tara:strand:+ start:1134 stop:2096 length:963 start_codon:yes stop_codon:yes gene_type:complete
MILFDQNTAIIELNEYLKKKHKFLNKNEVLIQTEIAGEGNMNLVMRLITNRRSFILKQSRPFVLKYPDLLAPLSRIDVEYNFYRQMGAQPFFPKILKYDPKNYLLLMEDLGAGEDLTSIYQTGRISKNIIQKLVTGLNDIHQKSISKVYPENRAMRKLNHEHIFILPFTENDFGLDNIQNGLKSLADPFKSNKVLNEIISDAGKLYMKKGDTLLHGDYYPGSWMRFGKRLNIIDPEFSFIGPKEFDLGVMVAHLILATGQESLFDFVCNNYQNKINIRQAKIYCGIEIIRRLIGLAQLPVKQTLKQKKDVLNLARDLVLC